MVVCEPLPPVSHTDFLCDIGIDIPKVRHCGGRFGGWGGWGGGAGCVCVVRGWCVCGVCMCGEGGVVCMCVGEDGCECGCV